VRGIFCFLLISALAASGGAELPAALAEENEIQDTSVWWSIISRFLDPACLRATLLPAPRRPQVVNENQTTEKLYPLGGNHRPSPFHP